MSWNFGPPGAYLWRKLAQGELEAAAAVPYQSPPEVLEAIATVNRIAAEQALRTAPAPQRTRASATRKLTMPDGREVIHAAHLIPVS